MKTRAGSAFLFLSLLVGLGGLSMQEPVINAEAVVTETACPYGYEPYGCFVPFARGGDFSLLSRM
ncbi:hypothetical protein IQ22_02255 [Pseudomonas duriflava]|uniref:Uncharacterized protein n=1 Tax=Pseudomonas duriflava TaxID=459528 RepID=A0A562QCB9_9PSED|nr:hypothetical protein [Pseudomonas duriflava]TWI54388.1 hypothetical protein IQ22_02255 [Pseudomonas duriflava]